MRIYTEGILKKMFDDKYLQPQYYKDTIKRAQLISSSVEKRMEVNDSVTCRS